MQKREDDEHTIDVDRDDELVADEEEVTAAAQQRKLKALREELRSCQKESAERLEGWQRARADLVNYRQEVAREHKAQMHKAAAKTVQALLPVLDSFAAALEDSEWQNVRPGLHDGMERIRDQLRGVLKDMGCEGFGNAGDPFSPDMHEAVAIEQTSDAAVDHTVARVLQQGYRIDAYIVRPAKVIVYQHNGDMPGDEGE